MSWHKTVKKEAQNVASVLSTCIFFMKITSEFVIQRHHSYLYLHDYSNKDTAIVIIVIGIAKYSNDHDFPIFRSSLTKLVSKSMVYRVLSYKPLLGLRSPLIKPKFQAASHLLWMYRPICVGPGRKSRRQVFSWRAFILLTSSPFRPVRLPSPSPVSLHHIMTEDCKAIGRASDTCVNLRINLYSLDPWGYGSG